MSIIEKTARFLNRLIIKTFYRLKVYGNDNIPPAGGALIVCNHTSYLDGPIITAAVNRISRGIIDKGYYNRFLIKQICKAVRSIPISASDTPRKIITSIREAQTALKAGEVVFIFAEGGMTRNGNMRSFKNGFEKISKGTDCAVIPAYIGGMWESTFSYYHGRPFAKLTKKIRRRISVHFGKALNTDATAQQVRLKVQELSCDYYNSLKSPKRSVGYRFIKTARRFSKKRCISDDSGKKLNYRQTLTASMVLADKLDKLISKQDKIGIIIPPSVGAALTNIAVSLLNKVPVNLNYSLSTEQINSAIDQCKIKTVITSKKLIEKLPHLKDIHDMVYLEDIAEKITNSDKIINYFKARFMPAHILAKTKQHNADDIATVIFSSGSSGAPKGVILSHHNILSNIDSMCSIFRLKTDDNLCAVLPFFHSFGFTCSLWLPILKGVSSSFVSNPLDCASVGKTAAKNKSTVLFAAPTFLINYIRKIEPLDFSNIRFVLAGAEKLKPKIADSFEKKFGIRPREGYGATEMSPAIAFNLDDIDTGGIFQTGTKDGSVGHPIPAVAVKAVDPQTHQLLEYGRQGLILAKGPNIMSGYINNADKTNEVIKDGWYVTGDIGSVDEDGFITITDRLSRFSKIGGEMIPHIILEQKLHELLNLDGHCIAVTGIADDKKGERLVVLYSPQAGDADKLYEVVAGSDLPNIFKPKRRDFICIENIPTLGSGKLDLMKIKQIAAASFK